MRKIEELMSTDKALHFLWMFFIIKLVSLITDNLYVLLLLTIVVAITKEIYDLKIKRTRFDWWDILATITGGVIAIFLI